MNNKNTIYISKDFTCFPAGRTLEDGPYSGEVFRESLLIPKLKESPEGIKVFLDGTIGYGSAWLDEAFGGLVRTSSYSFKDLMSMLCLHSEDVKLLNEIHMYMQEASIK